MSQYRFSFRATIHVLVINFLYMKNWIIGIVIAAVVLGGGYYLMNAGSLSIGDKSGDLMEKGAVFTGSWNDLVTRGGNYACEINTVGTAEATAGMVYVSGTNVRGDFTSVVSGKSVTSSMLKMGDTFYVWGGGMEQGIMMPASAMTGSSAQGTNQGSGIQADHSYDWNCSTKGADASKFVKPAGIEFMDMSAMMHGAGAR